MIMIGLLVIGFVCNELIKPVDRRFHEPRRRDAAAEHRRSDGMSDPTDERPEHRSTRCVVALAWLWVLVPFGYGLYQLLVKIPALFGG